MERPEKSYCTTRAITTFFFIGLFFVFGMAQTVTAESYTGGTNLALPDPIVVSTFDELLNAVQDAVPGDTILLEDGTYQISGTWAVAIRTNDLTIRSQSGNREAVILQGMGMHANGHHGFWIDAHNVTIADLTIQNVRNHCIQTDPDVDNLHVSNCILRDAGEQLLKVPYNSQVPSPSENGIVEDCLFEYSAGIGPRYYIGGIDVHFGKDWIVRNNIFKHIVSPENNLSEHAIHFWSDSENTLVEKNIIINCDRGIGFGLGSRGHKGGQIINNMVYTTRDVGIGLENSSNTLVFNNSVYTDNYPHSIEYRFAGTTGVSIINNLSNGIIKQREGGSALLEHNFTDAQSSWFVDIQTGDLHLTDLSEIGDNVVDKGKTLGEVTEDIDGESRTAGTGTDIGADEVMTTNPHVTGDLNGDGLVDILDVVKCVNIVLEGENDPDMMEKADINNDGVVDILDVMEIVILVL